MYDLYGNADDDDDKSPLPPSSNNSPFLPIFSHFANFRQLSNEISTWLRIFVYFMNLLEEYYGSMLNLCHVTINLHLEHNERCNRIELLKFIPKEDIYYEKMNARS